MPKFIPRTKAQNSTIHSLLNKFNFDADSKAEMVADITSGRTESTKEMSVEEANVMIKRLGGDPLSATGAPQHVGESRRTVQYKRQKAGVEQLATATHIDLMRSRARRRGITDEGLGDLSARVNKANRTPRTSKEVNRVVEAIKAMDARDKSTTFEVVIAGNLTFNLKGVAYKLPSKEFESLIGQKIRVLLLDKLSSYQVILANGTKITIEKLVYKRNESEAA